MLRKEENWAEETSGAKAPIYFSALMARLKPCPSTNHSRATDLTLTAQLRPGPSTKHQQHYLERADLEHDPQRDDRWPALRPTDRGNLRLALAALKYVGTDAACPGRRQRGRPAREQHRC